MTKNSSLFTFGVGLLLTVGVAGLIFFNIILPGETFHWDESHHSIYGVWLAKNVIEGNWASFWENTHRQTLWPPLHSWFSTLFFLVFGVSVIVARASSLFLFVLVVLLTYAVAHKLSKEHGFKIGMLAVLLCLTSPLLLSFAAQNMLEQLGAFLFMSGVYLYLLAEEKRHWYSFVALGVVLGLSVVTKYNYAYLMLASFAVLAGWELVAGLRSARQGDFSAVKGAGPSHLKKNKKTKSSGVSRTAAGQNSIYFWIYKNVLVWLPALGIALAWFFSGDSARKIQMVFWSQTEVAAKQGLLAGFWQNILFYPRALIFDYVFSPWLGLLVFLSIFPWVINRFKSLGWLYIIIWVSLLLQVFTMANRMNRLIFIFVPVIFIVFSATFVYFFEEFLPEFSRRFRPAPGRRAWFGKRWPVVACLVILLPSLWSLPRVAKMFSGDISDVVHGVCAKKNAQNLTAVVQYFRDNLPRNRAFSTAVNLHSLCPYSFYFYFHDWEAPVLTSFQAQDPNFFKSEYFVTVEIASTSPYYGAVIDDSVNRWNKVLAEQVQKKNLVLDKAASFEKIGIIAKIYKLNF